MAAHRKPKQRFCTGPAARTAATLALTGAATAAVLPGPAHADPQRTPAQVKAEVDRLYHDAEVATERYNGAKEKADAAEDALDDLRDEAARRTERLNTARDALGSFAAAQYRTGGLSTSVQLALSSDPDQYLERASYADRIGDRQAAALGKVRRQVAQIATLRSQAKGELAALTSRRAELKKHKATITTKLADARRLLDRLTPPERTAYENNDHGSADGTPSAGR
ncbi:coiled-coil domain-containing protein, partial [Streptomyces sp. Wh19]|uniref:coiled-coil domain-containing protein n=1 Tax=Streptomyces sp. Wh19 TaxID=3076629 RepID=UPI00295D94C1|nr:NlpC/P60 family protein [Streptomyces sp. Wh19]